MTWELAFQLSHFQKSLCRFCICIHTRYADVADHRWYQQEQLERLRSEDNPYYWVTMDPKSEEDKVKVTNLKNLPKFQFF